FVHHRAATASWAFDVASGFEQRDLGIAAATDGLADAHVLRSRGAGGLSLAHAGELSFLFVLDGEATLACADRPEHALAAGDAVALPPDLAAELRPSPNVEVLRVQVAAD